MTPLPAITASVTLSPAGSTCAQRSAGLYTAIDAFLSALLRTECHAGRRHSRGSHSSTMRGALHFFDNSIASINFTKFYGTPLLQQGQGYSSKVLCYFGI